MDDSSKFANWLRSRYLVLSERIEPHRQRIRLLAYLISAALALTTSSLLELAVDERLSGEVKFLLRILLLLLAVVFVMLMLVIAFEMLFAKKIRLVTPGRRSLEFIAKPYSAIPGKPTDFELARMGTLSEAVEDEFSSDTFRRTVIRHAIATGCGIGLQVADDTGRDMGFFDVYQLVPDALERWVHGKTHERDMTEADFCPLAATLARGQKELTLIVGAIMLTHPSPLHNFHVGPLLAAASRGYLNAALRNFETVTLYASIYSDAGRRYAELFGFKPYLPATSRGVAGGGNDMYHLTFRPGDPSMMFFSSTKGTTFLLRLQADRDQTLTA